jgi:hypothetical protein
MVICSAEVAFDAILAAPVPISYRGWDFPSPALSPEVERASILLVVGSDPPNP